MQLSSRQSLGILGAAALGLGLGIGFYALNRPERVSPPLDEMYRSYLCDLGRDLKSALRNDNSVDLVDVSKSISSEKYAPFEVLSRDYVLVLNPSRDAWKDYASDLAESDIMAVLLPLEFNRDRNNLTVLLMQTRWTVKDRFNGDDLINAAPWIDNGIRYGHENEALPFKFKPN